MTPFFSRFARTLAALPLAAVLFACASLPARAEPPMWVIKDSDSTIYLFGTVHILRPQTQWRTPRIDAALAESKELWMEILTPSDEEMAQVMGPLLLSKGLSLDKPLSARMTAEDRASLERAIRVAKLPADTAQSIEMMQPWMVAAVLETSAMTADGFENAAGVEEVLEASARREGDSIKALETIELQLNVFANLPEADQMAFLRDVLENIGDLEETDRIIDAWARGDLGPMEQEAIAMKRDAPVLHEAIATRRNENWAVQIEQMLKGSGTSFIAVGAGHFAGPDNVLERLRARGINAERY